MAEVLVLVVTTHSQRLASIVVRTIPLEREVYVFRDVTSERHHSVVAYIARIVKFIIYLRGGTCPADACHNIEVTLYRRYGEAVA